MKNKFSFTILRRNGNGNTKTPIIYGKWRLLKFLLFEKFSTDEEVEIIINPNHIDQLVKIERNSK